MERFQSRNQETEANNNDNESASRANNDQSQLYGTELINDLRESSQIQSTQKRSKRDSTPANRIFNDSTLTQSTVLPQPTNNYYQKHQRQSISTAFYRQTPTTDSSYKFKPPTKRPKYPNNQETPNKVYFYCYIFVIKQRKQRYETNFYLNR